MKKKILLSLLILCNLAKANTKTAEEAPKDALEDAIEHLDVKTVKDTLSKEQITANRKAMLVKYCQNITKLYRIKTTSIFKSPSDSLALFGGFFGILAANALLGYAIKDVHDDYKRSKISLIETEGIIPSFSPNKTLIFFACTVPPLTYYFSVKAMLSGLRLNHAFTNLKKARQIEYAINGIDL